MSKSWAGVAHGHQGGSDTQRSRASQETVLRCCWSWSGRAEHAEAETRSRIKNSFKELGVQGKEEASEDLRGGLETAGGPRKMWMRQGGGRKGQEEPSNTRIVVITGYPE